METVEKVCSGAEWLSVAAFFVALAALLVSILTVYLRDAYRGYIWGWFPDPEGRLPQDTGDPYIHIVNRSPFDIRVSELFIELKSGVRLSLDHLGWNNLELPIDIPARRSVKVSLHVNDFLELTGKEIKLVAQTDTGKRFGLDRRSNKKMKEYVQTQVAQHEATIDERQREIASSWTDRPEE